MPMTTHERDSGLDTLLDLHGQTRFVDEAGHWMKFVVLRCEVTPERSHGLSYSLTLHAPGRLRQRVPRKGAAWAGNAAASRA